MPKRKYRRANIEVSALALGSYYIGKVKTQAEAINAGVMFIDNAWEYNDGINI